MAPGPHADGSEVSDGALVTSASLPKGLLVVHDGTDVPADGDREITNLTFVDWHKVEHTLR